MVNFSCRLTMLRFIYKITYKFLSKFFKKKYCVFVYARTSNIYMNLNIFEDYLLKNTNFLIKRIDYNDILIKQILILSQARFIFVDQTNWLISHIEINKDQYLFQLWHGAGEYKAVAFDAIRKGFNYNNELKRISRLHGQYDYILCSDQKLRNNYSKIFNICADNVLCYGSPRIDKFFEVNIGNIRKEFYKKNNLSPDTKIIIYCPTFRHNYDSSAYTLSNNDLKFIESKINNCKIYVRVHPTLNNSYQSKYVLNNIDYISSLAIADYMISDYSSIIFDFSFFKRPIILYTPDINIYIDKERSLYHHPSEIVGSSSVTYKVDEIIDVINKNLNNSKFVWSKYMSSNNGQCSKLIVLLMNKLLKN